MPPPAGTFISPLNEFAVILPNAGLPEPILFQTVPVRDFSARAGTVPGTRLNPIVPLCDSSSINALGRSVPATVIRPLIVSIRASCNCFPSSQTNPPTAVAVSGP